MRSVVVPVKQDMFIHRYLSMFGKVVLETMLAVVSLLVNLASETVSLRPASYER